MQSNVEPPGGGAARGRGATLLSVFGVPLVGLGGLLLCLSHPAGVRLVAPDQSITILVTPDPRLDKNMAVCLRQQAKLVARSRQRGDAGDLALALAGYNLIARECTPAVFQATGLPPALER